MVHLVERVEFRKFLWPDERCADVRSVYSAFGEAGLFPTVVENTPRRLVVDARYDGNNASAPVCMRFLYDDAKPGVCYLEFLADIGYQKAGFLKTELEKSL